jgi:hypothetical protein
VSRINVLAVLVAAVCAFVMSSLYYSPLLLGNVWRAVDPVASSMTFSPWKGVAEIVRTLGITFVMARLLLLLGTNDVKSATQFALWIWFGFSALMWIGAIIWEGTPWQVAAIHSGDWLLKTLLIAVVLGLWSKRTATHGKP